MCPGCNAYPPGPGPEVRTEPADEYLAFGHPRAAHGLVEDSRRLGEVSRLEMGNSPQGQQINAQVNALLRAAEQFDREIKLRDQNLPRRQQAVRDLRRAYQRVFEVLTQPGLNAPGAQRIAERIELNINSLEDAVGIRRKPPETPVEERLQRALVREYTGIIAEMDTFMAGLNDKVPEGPQIRNEALALRDAVRKLRRFAALGAPDRRIVQELATAIAAQRVLAAQRGASESRASTGAQCSSPSPHWRGAGTYPERGNIRVSRFPIAASVSTRPIVSAFMVGPVQGAAPASRSAHSLYFNKKIPRWRRGARFVSYHTDKD